MIAHAADHSQAFPLWLQLLLAALSLLVLFGVLVMVGRRG